MRRRTLSLTEVAERLRMPKTNVRAFLARRGVVPVDRVDGRDRWAWDTVDAIARHYHADEYARAADRRRVETRQRKARA